MSDQFPSLADVLRKHLLLDFHDVQGNNLPPECYCGWYSPDEYRTRIEHPDHLADMWREACRVTTVEQLDALPNYSIVKTKHANAIVKINGQWWIAGPPCPGDAPVGPWIPDETVSAPYTLLHHPDWETK